MCSIPTTFIALIGKTYFSFSVHHFEKGGAEVSCARAHIEDSTSWDKALLEPLLAAKLDQDVTRARACI
jgi:hypothetical protein